MHRGARALSKEGPGLNASRMVVLVVNRVHHGVYPLNAVGTVQAQNDWTDSVTSSFHVQPLAIWALA